MLDHVTGYLRQAAASARRFVRHWNLQRAWLCPDLALPRRSSLIDEGGETYDSPSVRWGPTMTVSALAQPTGFATGIVSAATLPAAELLGQLGVTADQGLASDEVGRRTPPRCRRGHRWRSCRGAR